jgi:hypothetical protein
MSEDQTELETTKQLARDMEISFHPSIGLAALKQKIADADINSLANTGEPEKAEGNERTIDQIKADAAKLVRVRVTCMDPKKREYEGEIFSTGNAKIGTFKKYVHFGTEWHIPNIILKMLRQSKCQVMVPHKVRLDSGIVMKTKIGKLIPAYAIEVLPSLTKAELDNLTKRQAMASGTAETI